MIKNKKLKEVGMNLILHFHCYCFILSTSRALKVRNRKICFLLSKNLYFNFSKTLLFVILVIAVLSLRLISTYLKSSFRKLKRDRNLIFFSRQPLKC